MSSPSILVFSPVPGEAAAYVELLRKGAPDVTLHMATARDEVGPAAADAEVLLGWKFPQGLTGSMPRLRWIHKISAGVEDMLTDLARRTDLIVSRTDGSVIAPRMVEYVLGAIFATTQRFPRAWSQARARIWQAYLVGRASGRTVGVAGLGDIGAKIALALHHNGMRVVGWRRSDGPAPQGVESVYRGKSELHLFLSACDFVVSVLPATEETNDVFDAAAFAAMKYGAVFINVGRGNSVDEDALADALETGGIAGAVLDVFKTEPLPVESRLWGLGNLMMTPHVSGPLMPEDVISSFLDNLARFRAGERLHKLVDAGRGY